MEERTAEIWKDITDYEGLYQISNTGYVRRNGKILKPNSNRGGYLYVALSKNSVQKTKYIHQLVAEHFIGKVEGKEVDHIDSNKSNNHVSNLQYLTRFENASKGSKGRTKDNRLEKNPNAKRVLAIKDGQIIATYPCGKILCNEIEMNYSTFKKKMQNGGLLINDIKYEYETNTTKIRTNS